MYTKYNQRSMIVTDTSEYSCLYYTVKMMRILWLFTFCVCSLKVAKLFVQFSYSTRRHLSTFILLYIKYWLEVACTQLIVIMGSSNMGRISLCFMLTSHHHHENDSDDDDNGCELNHLLEKRDKYIPTTSKHLCFKSITFSFTFIFILCNNTAA